MKFLPVPVAFVSFCLVSFYWNPAFAAVVDAGATPEDAVAAPLEEPDDVTAASVIDATPEEAASVGPGRRRRRKLVTKKGGGTDEHGCDPSTGKEWCASRNECIRLWETACPTTSPVPTPPTPAPVPDSLQVWPGPCPGYDDELIGNQIKQCFYGATTCPPINYAMCISYIKGGKCYCQKVGSF